MCVSQIFRAHLLNNTEFIKINSRTQSTHYWLTGIEARLPFIRPQIWFVVRWWISTNRSAAWNTRGFRMQRRKVLSLVFDARFWWLIAAKRRRCQYWKKYLKLLKIKLVWNLLVLSETNYRSIIQCRIDAILGIEVLILDFVTKYSLSKTFYYNLDVQNVTRVYTYYVSIYGPFKSLLFKSIQP